MSVSKSIRFEVFKRDGFRCSYCGKTPPQTTLEIDHIKPKKHGGIDDINNLVTSCFPCNRGKGSVKLSTLPNSLQTNLEILKEQQSQLRNYEKFVEKIRKSENKKILIISKVFTYYYPKWRLTDHFNDISIRKFIRELGLDSVKRAMVIACAKGLDDNAVVSYFCGICWRKIKNPEQNYL